MPSPFFKLAAATAKGLNNHHQSELDEWRKQGTQNIDQAVLDWDAFSKDKDIDLSFDTTPAQARTRVIIDSYLELHSDSDQPVTDPLEKQFLRDRIAKAHFSGRGVGDDNEFLAQIRKGSEARRDSATLFSSLQREAIFSQIEAATAGTPTATFKAWHDQAKSSPGYNSDNAADYLEAWNKTQAATSEGVAAIAPQIKQVWESFQRGENTYLLAHQTYSKLDEAQRTQFLSALSLLAQRLPEDQQATFWRNLKKSTSRTAEGFATRAVDYLTNHIADTFQGSTQVSEKDGERIAEEVRGDMNFAHDIERIQHGQFDAVKNVWPEGAQIIEDGLYAIPGVLMFSAQAAIPGIGFGLSYVTIESQSYKQVRQTLLDSGLSDKDATLHASNWKEIIAVPSAALERLGASALVGRFPGAEKALTAASNKVTSKAGRYGMRAGVGALYETSIEVTQEFLPHIVQDLAAGLQEDVPEVDWHNGKDGVLDGFWAQTGSTFVAVLPLALIGAAGGFSAEARAKAWAKADDLHLKAAGATEQDIANIKEAEKQGPESLNKAVKVAIANADPRSESAQDATQELAEKLQAEKEKVEAAQKSGAIPRFQRTASGWELFDGQTDESIGTAPTASAAFRLAKQHSAAVDDADAETIAYLASMLQTIDETQNTRDTENQSDNDGPQTSRHTTTDFRPGEALTETQAAALSEQNAERILQQLSAKETLEQGDDSITRFVLGQSTTEFNQRTRHTTNRLQAGASVLTVFHEETHGFYREALETSRLTKADTITFLRAIEKTLAGKTSKDGTPLSLLPENDADITDTLLDEAVSEFMEAEILRTRGKEGARLAPGVISRNLSAIAKLAPEASQKFSAFIRAIRSYFGLALSRAHTIKKAIRDGEIDEKQIEEFTAKLFELNQQDEYDLESFKAAQELVPDSLEDADPFSVGTSPITAQQDADYMAAVESGDVVTQQSLVDAAAKAAGYDVEGFHGKSGAIPDIFKPTNKGENTSWESRPATFFATKKESAEMFAEYAANRTGDEPNVLRAYLKTGQSVEKFSTTETVESLKERGVNSTILKDVVSGELIEYAVFNPNQIKSADPITHDEAGNVIPLSQRFNQEKDSISFSMVPAHMVETLLARLQQLPTNPKQKAEYLGNVSNNLAKLRRDVDLHVAAFGKVGTIEAIDAPRTLASLKKERNMRQALREEELVDQAHAAAHGLGHMDEAVAKLRSQPVHEYLADPANSLRGSLISLTAAKQRTDFRQETLSQYDGSGSTSRTLFGGYLMPDQAAQELFDAGLIKEPTADAMWDALNREAQTVKQLAETLKTLKENLTAAKKQARDEADTWLKKKQAKQKKDHNPRSQVLRSLAMLDGILSTLPADIRVKVGGHTALARMNSDRARLNYLVKKVDKIYAELERYLRAEYDSMLQKLIERARPQKDKPGEKKTGKVTHTVHDLFKVLEMARFWSLDKADGHVTGLESEIAKGTLSPEEEAHKELESQLVPLVAEWGKADAARRAQAYDMARTIFEVGYFNHKLKKAKQAAERESQRQSLRASTGSRGTAAQRKQKAIEANGFKGRAINGFLSLLSFEQITHLVFGHNSKAATSLIEGELAASNAKEDATQERMQEIEDFFTLQAGTLIEGERLRYQMAQPSITVDVAHTGEKMQLTPFEAVAATLMWRQEDGKRHMKGHMDENNKPSGEWHYDQDFIDQIEKALDSDALSWRNFVANAYANEHGRINPVYQELYSVSLPSSSNYSPLTVQPVQTTGAQGVDPVTGQATNGASITPGSLKSRSSSAVAEPDFRDSLQTYIAHTKQIEHWIAYAPLTTEMRAIMNHRTVSNAIEGAAGKEALSVLRSWLDLFTEGGTRDASAHLALNKGLGRAISRTASSALIGRMSVLIIQSTQLGAAMVQMPMGAYVKRFSKLMTGRLSWGAALNSDYIQRRIKQLPVVVQQAMQGLEGDKPNAVKHAAARMGNLIGGTDGLFTAGTYAMIYDYQFTQAVKNGQSPAEAEVHAHKMAEQLTDQVAQPTRAGARSLYENKATNPLFKLLWAFSSEPRQKLALLAYNLAKKPTPQKLRTIALVFGINGLAAQLIRTSWRDIRDDEDDEIFDEKHWNPWRILTASATSPLDGIPVVGDMAESAVNGALGYWQPDGHLLDGADRAIRSAKHIDDIIAGDRDAGEILKDIDGILTGLAMTNETIAAASSFSHLARDLFDIAENLTK